MSSNSSSTQPKSINDYVEESIVKTKLVLAKAKMVHSSIDFKSMEDCQTYAKSAADAGLLVLKSSNTNPYPKTVCTLALYTKNEKSLFSICLEPDSADHLASELKDAVDGMPQNKPAHLLLAVASPNVAAAAESIKKLRQVYGDRLMTSSIPKVEKEKDVEAIVWFLAVANTKAHEEAIRITKK